MAYGVLAYPELKNRDFKRIQDFRKENDALYYSVVKPHFSFVFPVGEVEISKDLFIDEISKKSKGAGPIEFEFKCTTVNKDAFSNHYHLLLVPDKGYGKIVKLHDKLYSDLLFPFLRLDIDFIPHIGIANSDDKFTVKKWADYWNQKEFSIHGIVNFLTIVDYKNDVLTDLEKISLK